MSALLWGEYKNYLLLRYIFKPLTILLIISIPLTHYQSGDIYLNWILAALVFSMIGDVCLMFEKGFLLGLSAFLIGHLAYVAAFTSINGFQTTVLPLLILTPIALYSYIWLKPNLGKLKLPVSVYILVISLMGWQAWGLYLQHPQTKFLMAGFAAVIFIISDASLAIDKFKKKLERPQFIILPTYFAAQWLFALSAVWSNVSSV